MPLGRLRDAFLLMNLRKLLPAIAALLISALDPRAAQAQQPQAPVVKAIEVQFAGAGSIATEKILANMRTRVGRPYDERVVEEDIRNLYATGNVNNVRIFGEAKPDGVRVIVVIQSKAQLTEVEINGAAKLKPTRIRKEITSKPGDTLSEATIEADRQKIIDYYVGKGFTEVEVRTQLDVNEKLGTARVTFTVVEGAKVEIHSVAFAGNSALSSKELKKVVKTKRKNLLSFITKSGRLNSEALDADVAAIRDLYMSRGYIDIQVTGRRLRGPTVAPM